VSRANDGSLRARSHQRDRRVAPGLCAPYPKARKSNKSARTWPDSAQSSRRASTANALDLDDSDVNTGGAVAGAGQYDLAGIDFSCTNAGRVQCCVATEPYLDATRCAGISNTIAPPTHAAITAEVCPGSHCRYPATKWKQPWVLEGLTRYDAGRVRVKFFEYQCARSEQVL